VTRCGGPALRLAADAEPLQQFSVETNVELLGPSHPLDVVLVLPLQADLDEVLAASWKVVRNCGAAARSERQVLALPIVLHDEERNLESLETRTHGRKTD